MRVAVASLGGTIAMTPGAGGVAPSLSADDLLGDLASALGITTSTATLASAPSASLDFATVVRCYDWAAEQVAAGAAGVVVVQGTDTLEETAYFFDVIWPHDAPVVVTGAMRHPSLPGADGPANVVASLVVAAARSSRGRGALVVLNDEVHQARWVRKSHASRLDAFSSAPAGPLGLVVEGEVHHFHPAGERPPAVERPDPLSAGRVVLLESTLGDDGGLLDSAVAAGAAGAVIAATGVGHVSERLADAIERALPVIPVVVATRTGGGTTFRRTYGFRGSESDLVESGVTMAGWLCPRKARVLLMVLLASGASRDQVAQAFRERGQLGRTN
jgi:L-asparaginase